jgi:hypothetical protein
VIDYTTRPRIKQHLELQQRKFEKELSQLQEKQQKEQQQAAAQAEEKAANASAPSTASRPHTKDISVYGRITLPNTISISILLLCIAWDQTDKFVKIYVQNLNGADKLPENQIQCSFEDR